MEFIFQKFYCISEGCNGGEVCISQVSAVKEIMCSLVPTFPQVSSFICEMGPRVTWLQTIINCLNLLKYYYYIAKVHGDISSTREWEVEQQFRSYENVRLSTKQSVSSQEKSWQYFRGYLQWLFLSATGWSKIPSLKHDLFCL